MVAEPGYSGVAGAGRSGFALINTLRSTCLIEAVIFIQTLQLMISESERCAVLFGPYSPPRARPGSYLTCEIRGKVRVGEWSDSLVPWPTVAGKRSLVICGGLLRAIELESVPAISRHWGVTAKTVQKWRRALGVACFSIGSKRVHKKKAGCNPPPGKMWARPAPARCAR